MNNIGFKIKRLREKKNVSQEQLAYELDISQSNLSRIENGAVEKLDFLLMQKVCDFFDTDTDYFWMIILFRIVLKIKTLQFLFMEIRL